MSPVLIHFFHKTCALNKYMIDIIYKVIYLTCDSLPGQLKIISATKYNSSFLIKYSNQREESTVINGWLNGIQCTSKNHLIMKPLPTLNLMIHSVIYILQFSDSRPRRVHLTFPQLIRNYHNWFQIIDSFFENYSSKFLSEESE
jgi:hypothetical protein